MNKIIINTGLWSAITCLMSFIIWIISFTGISISSPLFFWTNLDDYIQYVKVNPQFFQYLAKSFMIVFALGYLVLSFVFYEFANVQRQFLAKIALTFSVMFALLATTHYFLQVSAVRFAINEGQVSGLEHFLQAKPTSAISSLNMLGWTLFLGLSSFFMHRALSPGATTRAIRAGLLINTVSCLLAGVGYLLQIDVITFLFINLFMGGGFLIMTVSSVLYFGRLKKTE